MSDLAAAADLVRDLLGRRLVAVTEAHYWYEGQRNDGTARLLHFWLHFEDKPALMFHGCGEHLSLEFVDPYPSYGMQECGEMRVGPAQEPDLLAQVVGQQLLDASLIQGYTSEPSVGGVRLRFEHDDLVVASLADEWVIRKGAVPTELVQYLTVRQWFHSED